MPAANPPRFSPNPEPLPNLVSPRQKQALEEQADTIAGLNRDDAKKLIATIHGLTLAGESTSQIAKLTGVNREQVLLAQRMLRARGILDDHAASAVTQFKTEGIILAIEGATEKIKSGDGRFIERMLEEGGVWSNSRGSADNPGAGGAINPGLPALQINIALPPGVDPVARKVFGQVLSNPKSEDVPATATQHPEQG
jgi:DNA-binding phage protein